MADDQHRKYLLTIQNPMDTGYTHDVIIDILSTLKIDYCCLSDEIATTGTPHTHVFIYRKTAIRAKTIRCKFPGVHYDYCYGTCSENRDYVRKEGKWTDTDKAETRVDGSFYEFGEMPDEKSEDNPDKADIIALVESGATTAEIIKSNPKFVFKTNDINILRETLLSEKYLKEQRNVEVVYLYGTTGSGKTRSIFEENEAADICRVTNYGNGMGGIKFDAYHGQSVLVFEEFNSQIPIYDMLNYIDRYPVNLPARYSDRVACYTKVYLTSNLPLDRQYVNIQHEKPEVWKAFLRRINRVVYYDENGQMDMFG